MRIAHLIIAHKNPVQLERLIRALDHHDAYFYIHIDKKTEIAPFLFLKNIERVVLVEDRMICNWGGFSFIETTIKLLTLALDSGLKFDFFNLLSAQDYPLKSPEEIHNFFANKSGSSFLSFDASTETIWWKEAENRYTKFHFTDLNFKFKYLIQKIVNVLMPIRKIPSSLSPLYGGNKCCWWTINRDCASYLVDFFKRNSEVSSFLKLTWGSDEFVIATILMNSPYHNEIVNENYRYIDWSGGGGHPKILKIEDLDPMLKSGMMFARKFDLDQDIDVLDKIDLNNASFSNRRVHL